ncbi:MULTISPECIES: ADP-ribosylglycohydrolase family protein [Calditerrivibrio]|uniref:ADP-ribosylation/Crystallin J1 n=1 Tax=Calditerrivibrio nitroreducens TaxID=477976 RepID=A0A2J6WG69_9BACT|nr:MAG: hypothetical protein C0187_07335 [Calditerrivibrio nitroreducens]
MTNKDAVSDCLHSSHTLEALNEINNYIKDRIAGIIAGNIIGDMLGAPLEGRLVENRKRPIKLSESPDVLLKNHLSNYNCTIYTDDTSMLLALTDSLSEKGAADKDNEYKKYRNWFFKGEYTPFGKAFGYGRTTKRAIEENIPGNQRTDNGNGALMRSSVISCFFYNRSREFIEKSSAESASVTHSHPVAIFTNIIYNIILRDLILGNSLEEALNYAYKYYYNVIEDINDIFFEPIYYQVTGYAVSTLQTAIWLNLESSSFEEAITKAISLGGDTDTIAAVTGAIAGGLYGYSSIPEILKQLLQPLIEKYTFLKRFF